MSGTKTQTRRVVKNAHIITCNDRTGATDSKCPYGVPGDRLWVKETFYRTCFTEASRGPGSCVYRADGATCGERGWSSSIHMPRWASRITLEVVGARVERVHEISAKDIIAEGAVERAHHVEAFEMVGSNPKCPISAFDGMCYPDLRSLWAAGWNSINGKGSWESNPFCWVIEFRRIK